MMQTLKREIGFLHQVLLKPLQGNLLIILVLSVLCAGFMIRLYSGHNAAAIRVSARAAARPEQPLNLNRASAEELCLLPGIGMVRATQIIEYRRQNGRFNSVDDLTDIPGIGPKTLDRLRPLLRIAP
jgi:comEA protein